MQFKSGDLTAIFLKYIVMAIEHREGDKHYSRQMHFKTTVTYALYPVGWQGDVWNCLPRCGNVKYSLAFCEIHLGIHFEKACQVLKGKQGYHMTHSEKPACRNSPDVCQLISGWINALHPYDGILSNIYKKWALEIIGEEDKRTRQVQSLRKDHILPNFISVTHPK